MDENPEILAKYQKLALEYSKLKAQTSVLKTAVADEQNKVSDLQDTQKKKDQLIRKLEQEVECLNFRNLQLSKRVSVLQNELEVDTSSKHSKNKSPGVNSGPMSESYNVLNAELQSRIEENERLHQQVYTADLEHGKKISELSSTIEQLQAKISELEQHSTEKIKEQEIMIDTLQKEKIKMQVCIKNHEKELKMLNSTEEIRAKDISTENEELARQLKEMKKVIANNICFDDKSKDELNMLTVPVIQRGKHNQLSSLMLKMQTFVYDFCRQLSDLHTFMIQRLCLSSPDSSIKTLTIKFEMCLRESIQQLKVIPLNFENIASAIKAETLTWGSKKKAFVKEVGWFALKTTAISGAVLGGAAIAVPALGFTAGGVAAGSLAAAYQSAFLGGTIASGSAFAVLQSVGVLGLAASTQAGVVVASAVTAGIHTVSKKIWKKKDEKAKSCNCEKEKKNCSCQVINDKSKMESKNDSTTDPEEDDSNDEFDFSVEPIVFENSLKKSDKKLKLEILDDTIDILNETSPESFEKWKDVQLTDDVTITQHILKKSKF